MVEVTVDATEVVERKADDRGRVNLGKEFADAEVEVAVVSVSEPEDDDAQSAN